MTDSIKINWRNVGEAVAVLSVIVSLAIVVAELRQNRDIATDERFLTSASMTTDIVELISSHSSIWSRGCVGEELAMEEDFIFGGLVWAVDRHHYYRWRRRIEGVMEGDINQPASTIARVRAIYPGFDKKWQEIHGPAHSGTFAEAVNREFDMIRDSLSIGELPPSLCGISNL